MYNPQRSLRPRLTLRIFKFALLDVVGMILLALGVAWFAQGPGAFFKTFPSTGMEAALLTVVGIALMVYSVARILREIMAQQSCGQ